jgi:glutaredoxin
VVRPYFLFLSVALALPAQAYEFLTGYDTAPSVAAAMERVRAQPQKHVLVYFGNSDHCPPCEEARAILNHKYVRDRWAPNYVVVNIDLFAPTKEEREVIGQVKVSWAPVIVFLSGNGTRVAYSRQLRSEREAMQLNEYVSQRLYAQSPLNKSLAQGFDPERVARIADESRAVPGSGPIDDRPRVKDVLAQEHERLSGEALAKLLPGKRMHKENQDWYLTLDLRDRKLLVAEGKRKDGRGEMTGSGKWYVTKKGKLCVDLLMRDVDERWCRHVLRTGAGAYYVSRDLRPNRLAYRFTLR